MRMVRFGFVAALTGGISGFLMWAQTGAAISNDKAQGKVWWAHVQKLADPSMNGRLTGSEDYLRAAAYVVDQFKAYGLTPAGVDRGYYPAVDFVVRREIARKPSISLVADGKGQPRVPGEGGPPGLQSLLPGT